MQRALPGLAPVRRRERALRAHARGLAARGAGPRQGDAGGTGHDSLPACGRRQEAPVRAALTCRVSQR